MHDVSGVNKVQRAKDIVKDCYYVALLELGWSHFCEDLLQVLILRVHYDKQVGEVFLGAIFGYDDIN